MSTEDQGGEPRQVKADDFEGAFDEDEQALAAGEQHDPGGDEGDEGAGGEAAGDDTDAGGATDQHTSDHGAGFDGETAGSGEGEGADTPGQGAGEGDDAAGQAGGQGSGDDGAGSGEGGGEGEPQITADAALKDLAERFETDPDKRTPERVLHKVRTWHGRLNTLRQENEQLQQQVRQKDQQLEQLQQAQPGGQGSEGAGSPAPTDQGSAGGSGGAGDGQPSAEITDEHRRLAREEIAVDNSGEVPAYVDDNDIEQRARHIAQREAAVAQRVTAQVREELDSRVSPLENRHQESAEEQHFSAIREKHSDFDDVIGSDDFDLWRQEQPPRLRQTIDEVMESGTADDVNWMLDEYKEARGLSGSGTGGSGDGDPASGQGEGAASQGAQPSTPAAPPRQPSRPAAGPGRAAAGGGSFDEGFDRTGS